MPEHPDPEAPPMQGVWERRLQPGAPLPPHPRARVPLMGDAVRVWLSSEFISPGAYFGFDPPVAVYEGAGWPIGVRSGQNSAEQAVMSDMCEGYFDGDVRSALELPRRYTGLGFRPPPRRDMANLWIRHVGRWDGEPDRLADIVAGLARLPKNRHPDYKYHALYAMTPFSVIGQVWCEPGGSEPAYVVDTTIAFFFTFETLIQECFITDARRAGAGTAEILAAYEHRYANVRAQPNLLLRDPTTFKLSRYANPSIDWDSIRATPENSVEGAPLPGWEARSQRYFLFKSRLQTHLMVAIAAACQGLANFAGGRVSSALVRAADVPPSVEALAPQWLGHMTGDYDHATECADLLLNLARDYEQDLSSEHLHGIPIPPFQWSRDEPEFWPVGGRPLLEGCTSADSFDAYRWNLFDVPLDDASVIHWGRNVFDWVVNAGWKKPDGTDAGRIS